MVATGVVERSIDSLVSLDVMTASKGMVQTLGPSPTGVVTRSCYLRVRVWVGRMGRMRRAAGAC